MANSQQNTDKIDRLSIWIIAIIGIVAIFGGVLQVRSHLYIHDRTTLRAFYERVSDLQNQDNLLSSESDEAQNLAEAENRDTDNDGLNDAHELTIYNTSPYLSDSDSDGIDDKTEIESGQNPNCPEGTACSEERTGENGDGATVAGEEAFSDFNTSEVLGIDLNSDDIDVDQVRQALKDQGVPADQVDALSDEELLEALQQLSSATSNGSNGISEAQQYAESIRALSTDEKRDFLRQAGVTNENIDGLSDEEVELLLNDIIDEILEEEGLSSGTTGADAQTTDQTAQ